MITETHQTLAVAALLEKVGQHDAAAMSGLYDRTSHQLYAVILRILRDAGEAEDVRQEVYLRVWERAESFNRSLGAPIVWLVRVVRNLAIDRLRSRLVHVRNREENLSDHEDCPPFFPPARHSEDTDPVRHVDVAGTTQEARQAAFG